MHVKTRFEECSQACPGIQTALNHDSQTNTASTDAFHLLLSSSILLCVLSVVPPSPKAALMLTGAASVEPHVPLKSTCSNETPLFLFFLFPM